MAIPQIYPFLTDMIERTVQARVQGARVICVQSVTGSGKTSYASALMKRAVLKGSCGIFLAHARKLVDQISGRLEEFEVNHGIIMRGEKLFSHAPVQVVSRDTMMSRHIKNDWLELPPADLIIVDEGHHAFNPVSGHRQILSRYPKATVILLTATPIGTEGQGPAPYAQALVCGPQPHELIEGGYLTPVKCYAPDRKTKRGKPVRGIAGDLVESWKQYAEDQPTALFCSRIQHSLDAVAQFNEAGIPFAHMDAETPDWKREEIIADLESGKLKGISNVDVLSEGVDIPCLGCCQFWMEVQGRVAFLQRVGRIMRKYPGKSHGILIDHAGAIFRHGFPDEPTEWTLEGDTDARFKSRRLKGLTENVNFCKHCERLFSSTNCPGCGRPPQKAPRSIFMPEPVESREGELLVEADRGGDRTQTERDQREKHYLRCLGVAARRNGTFAMASVIYKQKYGEWPAADFPCNPGIDRRNEKVAQVYPGFAKGRKRTA